MKPWKWVLVILAAVLVLTAASIGVYTVRSRYIRVGDSYVSKSSEALDLRQLPLTEEAYKELKAQLPQCDIRWNVPIGSQSYDSHGKSVTLAELEAEQIPLFRYFVALESIELGEQVKASQWAQLKEMLPQCSIRWVITLGTKTFSPLAEYLNLDGTEVSTEELELKLKLFGDLKEVKLTDRLLSAEQRQRIRTANPGIRFQWHVDVDGSIFLNTATHISLGGLDATCEALIRRADELKHVRILDVAGCGLDVSAMLALKYAFHAELRGDFVLFDRVVSLDVEELDLSGIPMENTQAVEQALTLLPKLKKVIMCDCGIPSEEMDAMGQRHPQIKFVWNVRIGRAVIRTDVTSFISCKFGYWPVGGVGPLEDADNRLFDEDCVEFKYCRDMIALDLGHMALTDFSFLQYMPDLEYLILADNPATDFSDLQYVPKLVFLEMFMTEFDQAEVLTQLKNLKDLNLGFSRIEHWEPLMEMTWLERLWIPGTRWMHTEDYYQLKAALPDTQLVYKAKHSTDLNWRGGRYYKQMRDLLGMPHLK